MLKIRHAVFALGLLLSPAAPADDVRVSIGVGIGFPNARIGIHIGDYPRLVAIPGYPVYYAPRVQANFFFYDGLYWVFHDDDWYASDWYDGPWSRVHPMAVPVYVLRIPVRYYRHPPRYFRGWKRDAPPRWGQHWGHNWERQRSGWDRWNPRAVPPPAPLPAYQRRYSGDGYPRQLERQRELHREHYRYQPREPVARDRYRERYQAPSSPPRAAPPRTRDDARRSPPPPQEGMYRRDSQSDRPQSRRDNDRARDPERGRGRERGRDD